MMKTQSWSLQEIADGALLTFTAGLVAEYRTFLIERGATAEELDRELTRYEIDLLRSMRDGLEQFAREVEESAR